MPIRRDAKLTNLTEDLKELGVYDRPSSNSLSERRRLRRKKLREMFERGNDIHDSKVQGIEKTISEIDRLIDEIRSGGRFKRVRREDTEPSDERPSGETPDEKTTDAVEVLEEIVNLLQVLEGKFDVYEDQDVITKDEVDAIDKEMGKAKEEVEELIKRVKEGDSLTVDDFRGVLKEVVSLVQEYLEVSEDISSVEKEVEKETEKEPVI